MFIRLAAEVLLTLVWTSGALADPDPDQISAMLDKAQISLSDAIQKAQEKVAGGTLLGIKLEARAEAIAYQAEFFINDAVKQVEVDAVTGDATEARDKVLPVEIKAPVLERGKAVQDSAANLKLDPAAALKAAADATAGRPYEMMMKVLGDRLVCDIRVLSDGKLREAMVAADTREVLRVQDREKR
jgi:uncharacterized membrane protein YkoI